ncbi:MAG: hypothetical protein ED558_16500 [Oricola sp.]|nr:MAG: hypothetical protein ED558_16500 [Oricola sp.]
METKPQRDSPFFDELPQEHAQRAVYHARETYDYLRRYQWKCIEANVEYGKWLVASLLFVHVGAVFVITQTGDQALVIFRQVGAYHLVGIVSAFACGFSAWLNFRFLEERYDRHVSPAMTYRRDMWPDWNSEKRDPINATFFFAVGFGILSLLMMVFSFSDFLNLI